MLEELPTVADAANADQGEAHPDIWDFYTCTTASEAASLTLKLAWKLNRFTPISWEALPYAQGALMRALDDFVARKLSVSILCKLVENLDTTFNIRLNRVPEPESLSKLKEPWMGNLWNNCDWCDDSWSHENRPALVEEAQRVARMLREALNARAE
ncbi:hypothetical protein [Herbaspirillum lusitanum]|uniref:hypothetical protein n=1 Tax=Herbaspirillum lusitanum TaxID=213312 RepID=UPI002237E707|nr:hypothetical protein [Herbaspirillum lusitanum]